MYHGNHTQSKMSGLRRLEFEKFPVAVRFRIYALLLIYRNQEYSEITVDLEDISRDDDDMGDYHDKMRDISDVLAIEPFEPYSDLHPAILRTNKKIHTEASIVLWGMNLFKWSLWGDQSRPMWHPDPYLGSSHKTQITRRCSRLITRMHLTVSLKGDENDPYQSKTIYWTTANLDNACKKLCLNDLEFLMVDFYNGFTGSAFGRYQGVRYYGQHCLEPLKKVRAQRVGYLIWQVAS